MVDLLLKPFAQKKQISPHISKIDFNFGLIIFSIWLVESDGLYFLVDTGLPALIKYAIKHYFPQDLEAVFLTHGHADHIGGLTEVRQSFPNLVLVIDEREFPYISGELPYPNRKKPEKKVFEPGLFVTTASQVGQDLLAQAGLKAIFSPGHAPGHTCYYHEEDQVLIAGDLFTSSQSGKLRPPMKMFTADMRQALASGREILERYPEALLSLCHGKDIKNALVAFEAADGFRKAL